MSLDRDSVFDQDDHCNDRVIFRVTIRPWAAASWAFLASLSFCDFVEIEFERKLLTRTFLVSGRKQYMLELDEWLVSLDRVALHSERVS